MKILIDPGHGRNTAGKRSPDGRFLEYKFNRQVSNLIVADLLDKGHDARLIVPRGPLIQVMEPQWLADEIKRQHEEAAQLYEEIFL